MFKKKQEQKSKRYPDGPVELFAADLSSGLKRLPLMLVLEIPEWEEKDFFCLKNNDQYMVKTLPYMSILTVFVQKKKKNLLCNRIVFFQVSRMGMIHNWTNNLRNNCYGLNTAQMENVYASGRQLITTELYY